MHIANPFPIPLQNIEAGNILVNPSGVCKLSGFGNAQCVDDDCSSWTPMRGTAFWTAPEVIRNQGGKRYGPKVDIWGAGCVLLKMWTEGRALRDIDMITLVVKVSRASMSHPGALTEIDMPTQSMCVNRYRDWGHGDRLRGMGRLHLFPRT